MNNQNLCLEEMLKSRLTPHPKLSVSVLWIAKELNLDCKIKQCQHPLNSTNDIDWHSQIAAQAQNKGYTAGSIIVNATLLPFYNK